MVLKGTRAAQRKARNSGSGGGIPGYNEISEMEWAAKGLPMPSIASGAATAAGGGTPLSGAMLMAGNAASEALTTGLAPGIGSVTGASSSAATALTQLSAAATAAATGTRRGPRANRSLPHCGSFPAPRPVPAGSPLARAAPGTKAGGPAPQLRRVAQPAPRRTCGAERPLRHRQNHPGAYARHQRKSGVCAAVGGVVREPQVPGTPPAHPGTWFPSGTALHPPVRLRSRAPGPRSEGP
jgi:hypothetical protein